MRQETIQKLHDVRYIFARNVFIVTNGIIFLVCVALYIFGDTQAALFLGGVLLLNMSLGLAQDIRSWFTLVQLQFLTAPRVTRIGKDNTEEAVLVEEIAKGDNIKLKTGDQVPCDGVLMSTSGLELNEGLITGESASLPRKNGDRLLAGSIITSGTGVMRVDSVFRESRIARMTEGVKRYAVSMSPIQREVARVVTYSGYVLFALIAYTGIRGMLVHAPSIEVVKNIGALTSIIVPQGLVFTMTLLFAYGAAHLFNRNVLLQEVNATEKLGRIRNLCMDKTGTLTENSLAVERMICAEGVAPERAKELMAGYIRGSGDSSQTINAVTAYLNQTFEGNILAATPFSSWHAYGTVELEEKSGERSCVLVGGPELFLPHLRESAERGVLQQLIDTETVEGKRLLVIVSAQGGTAPADLEGSELALVAVFVFASKLRPGIHEAIDFFQKRGVRLRIISGDNPNTVRAVASAAGVNECEKIITGAEMSTWTDADFAAHSREYTIFARTIPEQKERIIEALRKDGFTAMVGDGANDALAIKKADLGIAMFDGAPATRSVASVVLTNNSFTALPGGVELADSIIKNAEVFAGLFFVSAFTGFFLFLILAFSGNAYQLTPLNVTLINYFAVGIPGILISYWTIRPAEKIIVQNNERFLGRVLPFVAWSGAAQVAAIAALFFISPEAMRSGGSNLLVILGFIFTGIIFFFFAPRVYRGKLTPKERRELWIVCVLEVFLLLAVFQIPLALRFFEVSTRGIASTLILPSLLAIAFYTLAQFVVARVATKRG